MKKAKIYFSNPLTGFSSTYDVNHDKVDDTAVYKRFSVDGKYVAEIKHDSIITVTYEPTTIQGIKSIVYHLGYTTDLTLEDLLVSFKEGRQTKLNQEASAAEYEREWLERDKARIAAKEKELEK
jgi:hypothetical protein